MAKIIIITDEEYKEIVDAIAKRVHVRQNYGGAKGNSGFEPMGPIEPPELPKPPKIRYIKEGSKKIIKQWEGETCKICGRDQRLAWSVKDKIWKSVMGDTEFFERIVCLECFLKEAYKKRVDIKKKHFNDLDFIPLKYL